MMHCNLGKKLHAATGDMQMEVSFTAGQGEFISIYGASGAGKTSILRMLAGFFDADHGMISFDDEVWFDSSKKIKVAPQKRRIGFVFQDYALFPNMSVRENLLFALTPGDRSTIVDELMEATGLEQMNNRRVQTLSGGQKQRVALARALVRKPELLLLDEPLSAIDHELRVKLQDILLNLHRSYRLITVLVSHDIPEIIRLSDKTIILQEGKIKKYGPPAELFFEPQQEEFFSVAGSVAGVEKKGNSCTVTVLTDRQVIKITSAANDLYDLLKGDAVSITTNEGSPAIVRKLLKDH